MKGTESCTTDTNPSVDSVGGVVVTTTAAQETQATSMCSPHPYGEILHAIADGYKVRLADGPDCWMDQSPEDTLRQISKALYKPDAYLIDMPVDPAALSAIRPSANLSAVDQMILTAGAQSGNLGAMSLAAQLVGVFACGQCFYVKTHCQCLSQEATAPPEDRGTV